MSVIYIRAELASFFSAVVSVWFWLKFTFWWGPKVYQPLVVWRAPCDRSSVIFKIELPTNLFRYSFTLRLFVCQFRGLFRPKIHSWVRRRRLLGPLIFNYKVTVWNDLAWSIVILGKLHLILSWTDLARTTMDHLNKKKTGKKSASGLVLSCRRQLSHFFAILWLEFWEFSSLIQITRDTGLYSSP